MNGFKINDKVIVTKDIVDSTTGKVMIKKNTKSTIKEIRRDFSKPITLNHNYNGATCIRVTMANLLKDN